MDWLIKFAKEFGVPIALVCFFVWQGSVREGRMTERIENLETYMRGKFEMVIEKNTEAMNRVIYRLEQEGK